jgi:hypothetical protein
MRFFVLSLLLAPVFAISAELRSVSVDKIDGHYVMHSEVWFDVAVEQLYGVLLDYDLGTQFSSVIVESKDLDPDEQGRPQFYTRHQACLLLFCMNFERYGHVNVEPNVTIIAVADPETSDFHVSREVWQFSQEGEGTFLVYDVDLKPKFWIPPVIGPFILKRKLISGGTRASNRIEAIARVWPNVGE